MKTILLNRHAGTEDPESSLFTLFSGIERIVSDQYKTLLLPTRHKWSSSAMKAWITEKALKTDLIIASDPQLIKLLRQEGWNGKVIFMTLGELPRGASVFRNALPYLYETDMIWCSCTADKQICAMLIQQDSPKPEITVLPFGIDCEAFVPLGEADRQHLRKTWNVGSKDFVIIYANRITPEKNFHSVLEVLHYLIQLGKQPLLLVAGRIANVPFSQFNIRVTDLAGKIHRLTEQLDLLPYVRYLPWLDQSSLNQLYNIGDVFINLTLHHDENFGYSQVEAMSAGLPVLGTAWGGLKDTIIDGQNGFLSDTWISDYGIRFDVAKLLSVLNYLIDTSTECKRLATYARYYAEKYYSWAIYNNRLLKMIDAVLSKPVKRDRARYSEFGASLHSRFNIKDELNQETIAVSPLYSSLSDPHYTQLVAPYTSLGRNDVIMGSELYLALTGKIEGNFYFSTDLLWPIRIGITDLEKQILSQLSRHKTVSKSIIDYPETAIASLIKKGLIGISQVSLHYS